MGTRHVKGSSSGKKIFCKGLQSLGGSTTRRGAKDHKAWDRKAQSRCVAAFVCDTCAFGPWNFLLHVPAAAVSRSMAANARRRALWCSGS
jgi:hypothetical protein